MLALFAFEGGSYRAIGRQGAIDHVRAPSLTWIAPEVRVRNEVRLDARGLSLTEMSPDMRILTHLQNRTHDTASNIGKLCNLAPGEVRGHLARMASVRLLTSYSLNGSVPPSRVYAITNEGLRKCLIEGC
jgi:hypothetical protein